MTELWEDFQYQFLETGWFDHDDRVKTVEAMRKFGSCNSFTTGKTSARFC